MYKDADYAHSRLAGTIVRYENKPVTVQKITGQRMNAYITALDCRKFPQETKKVLYKDLDVTPVPLGFCLTDAGISYLQRMPKRHDWRQGLRHSNFTSSYGADSRYVSNPDLSSCILGHHLNLALALDESDNLRKSIPFCREFGVHPKARKPELLYKWYGVVGDFVNGKPQLFPKFNHLNELLEERIAP